MSFAGYDDNGLGLTQAAPLASYQYDQKQYYDSPSMGQYTSTSQVYIIRHGDGTHYSKISIDYEYAAAVQSTSTPARDIWAVSYQNF
jgi:hypothetical protein